MVLQYLEPQKLAGVLGAILTGENISKPQVWVAYQPSKEVTAAVEALEPDRELLYKAQSKNGVLAPLSIDLRLAGAVNPLCNDGTIFHRNKLLSQAAIGLK